MGGIEITISAAPAVAHHPLDDVQSAIADVLALLEIHGRADLLAVARNAFRVAYPVALADVDADARRRTLIERLIAAPEDQLDNALGLADLPPGDVAALEQLVSALLDGEPNPHRRARLRRVLDAAHAAAAATPRAEAPDKWDPIS